MKMNRIKLHKQVETMNKEQLIALCKSLIDISCELEDRKDKAIETIEQLKKGSYIEYTDTTALAYHTPQPCCIVRLDVIEKILRGEDNDI